MGNVERRIIGPPGLLLSMAYDNSKIDEIVLALLGATEFENGRVWKRIDFAVMDRLHVKGYISKRPLEALLTFSV